MDKDLPTAQLSELFNVNHFIVSQANPHAALLSALPISALMHSPVAHLPLISIAAHATQFLQLQIRGWLNHMVNLASSTLPEYAIRRGVTQMLLQEYEGRDCDVTIFAWHGHSTMVRGVLKLADNLSREDLSEVILAAERNTWPHLAKIKSHCAIEFCLEESVQRLRRRLAADQKTRLNVSGNGGSNPSQPHETPVSSLEPQTPSRVGRVPSFFTSPSENDIIAACEDSWSDTDGGVAAYQYAPLAGYSGHAVVDHVKLSLNPSMLSQGSLGDLAQSSIPSKASKEKSLATTSSMAEFYYHRSESNESLHTAFPQLQQKTTK